MKSSCSFGILSAAFIIMETTSAGASLVYPNFLDTSGLQISGDAYQEGNALRFDGGSDEAS